MVLNVCFRMFTDSTHILPDYGRGVFVLITLIFTPRALAAA